MSRPFARILLTLRSPRKTAIAAFALITIICTVAYATTGLFILDTDTTFTEVSGTRFPEYFSDDGVLLQRGSFEHYSPEDPYQALYGVSISEGSNVPCGFKTFHRDINDKNQKLISTDCGTQNSERRVEFTNQNRYIRGIQVCQRANNNRIKGIRIFGASVNPNTGAVTILPNAIKEFERPNCNSWSETRMCPVGKIASGVTIHRDTGPSKHAIIGLSLRCKSVIPEPEPAEVRIRPESSTPTITPHTIETIDPGDSLDDVRRRRPAR